MLGRFEARLDGRPVEMPTRHCELLLALLALEPDRPLGRDMLATLLWPDRNEAQARTSMRQALYRLKNALQGADPFPLEIDARWVRLDAKAVTLDAVGLNDTSTVPGAPANMLDIAGTVPLDGLDPEGEELATRLDLERSRLRRLLQDAMLRQSESLTTERKFADVEALARRRLALEPYDEAALRDLMTSAALQGRRNAALDAYRTVAARLRDALSVAPEPETQALYDQIRTGKLETKIPEPPHPEPAVEPEPVPEPATHKEPPSSDAVRYIAVLHVIGRGLTSALLTSDPETAEAEERQLYARLDEIAARSGGSRLMQQGAEAAYVFGTSRPDEEPALSAAVAALDMSRFSTAAAVHSGDALTGSSPGSGPVALLAREIAMATPAGEARLSSAARAECRGALDIVTASEISVAGLPEPLPTWRISGTASNGDGWAARQARGLSAFVGRQESLAQLARYAEDSRSGPRVVLITGEAGLGKSRLVQEFLRRHARCAHISRVSFPPRAHNGSTLSFGALLRAWADPDGNAPAEVVLDTATASLGDAAADYLPALAFLLDRPDLSGDWMQKSRDHRRRDLVEAIRVILELRAQDDQSVLVVEDAHWADQGAVAILDRLVSTLGSTRLLMLVTCRPEFENDWARLPHASQLRLDGLDTEAAQELVRSLIGDAQALPELGRRLAQEAGGIPLYIEEVLRSISEAGHALPGTGGPEPRNLSGLTIPPSIRGVLALRIERLGDADRKVLDAAAVIGASVPEPLLAPLSGLDPDTLSEALDGLAAADLLLRVRSLPFREYTFKHALTLEAAYRAILPSRRQALHRTALELCERVYAGELDAHVEEMADHARLGGLWERAADLLEQAADKAVTRSAYQRAVPLFDRALDAAARLEQTAAQKLRQADLHRRMRGSLMMVGEFEKTEHHLLAAEALSVEAGDRIAMAEARIHMAYYHATDGGFDTLFRCCDLAEEDSSGLDEPMLLAEIASARLQGLRMRGEFAQAARQFRDLPDAYSGTNRLFRGQHLGTRLLWACCHLSVCHAYAGDDAAVERVQQEAHAVAAETRRPVDQQYARHSAGVVARVSGRPEEAMRHLEEALDIVRQTDLVFFEAWILSNMGETLLDMGDIDRAMEVLRSAAEDMAPRTARVLRVLVDSALGKGQVLAGQYEKAEATLTRVIAEAQVMGHRNFEQLALRRVAGAVAHRDLSLAETHLRASLRIADETGNQRDRGRGLKLARELGIEIVEND